MRGNRGGQYAINDYKAAGHFPTKGYAYRGCRSQSPAVIRITVARSSNWTATPSRKATTLLELAGTRSPGTPADGYVIAKQMSRRKPPLSVLQMAIKPGE